MSFLRLETIRSPLTVKNQNVNPDPIADNIIRTGFKDVYDQHKEALIDLQQNKIQFERQMHLEIEDRNKAIFGEIELRLRVNITRKLKIDTLKNLENYII